MEQLASMNVEMLRKELRSRGLDARGRKKELVERLHVACRLESEKNDETGTIEEAEEIEELKGRTKRKLDDIDEGLEDPRSGIRRKVTKEANGEDESLPVEEKTVQKSQQVVKLQCPYLDTVNRSVLDFDFEKCCSISLSSVNVYACLVCGKYFQGRGPKSHAYTHCLEADHHMFMKLTTGKVYCLPDDYEVEDRTLDDIRRVLTASFSVEQIAAIDNTPTWSRSLDGTEYMPGTVGLNNTKHMDYANTVIQCLMRVTPLRNFFLNKNLYSSCESVLVQRFGELVRKLWNPHNFKSHVSPLELMHTVAKETNKRFHTDELADPTQFLSWLLNTLHRHLNNGQHGKTSIVSQCFQGIMQVTTEKGSVPGKKMLADEVQTVPFFMLGLDLPSNPLYRNVMDKHAIPQVQLFTILQKYDGKNVTDDPRTGRRTFKIVKLPPYLILHVKRFSRNQFFKEKNRTIVTFPVKNLDLGTYIPLEEDQKHLSKYDLIGNICHQGPPEGGCYQCQVHRKSDNQWYKIEDLHVERTLAQIVSLSETYIQFFERNEEEKRS